MDDDTPRCPRCGKRVDSAASTCGACGYELVPHRSRARCGRCGNRIPAEAAVCPRCGVNRADELERGPRPNRLVQLARIGAIVVAALVCLCAGWVFLRVVTTNTLSRAIGLTEPIETPTQPVEVIYVVATPPTGPAESATAPRARPSATTARTATRAPTLTPTATRLPPGFYPAPELTSPANATIYQGAGDTIVLQWKPVSSSALQDHEWYAVTVSFTARDGSQMLKTGWSKESHWQLPGDWWNQAATDARIFQWSVAVVRIEGADPTVSPTRTPISPPSPTRTFIWN
ncbi:MAG: zinc ribbon domain-containing protein [Chloroflexi bacterium]|nr:zinc ribbon domain-containing protein [Chloroflexota bacterium]